MPVEYVLVGDDEERLMRHLPWMILLSLSLSEMGGEDNLHLVAKTMK